ncbi:MAG: Lcl domain-containing protein [Planctomycetota bacterium]
MNQIRRTMIVSAFLAALSIAAGTAHGQATNQIIAIDPNSAAQGTTGLLVTFTLDNDVPPPPPAGIMPNSVTIGSINGTSVTHSSQYIVTAVFDIPAGEPTGAKDAIIVFPIPQGTLTYSMAGGFTVTSGVDMPPSITQHPQSQTIPPGGAVTFNVTASGTEPLGYQWQKNAGNISGATGTSYTIDPVAEGDAGLYRCVVTNNFGSATSDEAVLTVAELPIGAYPVVDTGQTKCYNDSAEITCPAEGAAFYGQDAQYAGNQSSYTLSGDGKTVLDNVTGLTWQRSPDINDDSAIDINDKLTWSDAVNRAAALNAQNFGGYSDWRCPTIKELYSLIDFSGMDPSGCDSLASCPDIVPFIDTDYFAFAYGDTGAGERIIDSQYWSGTAYVATIFTGQDAAFGVNFADGRIKGYPQSKSSLVLCVRGNTDYGINNFVDNGNGTITDRGTGLMWTQNDSGTGMYWEDALTYAENLTHVGYNDWRLPNAKELQSIIDYTRSPDTTSSAAIDPVFAVTSITNEAGQIDYPFYWAGSTHATWTGSGNWGTYVAFGRGLGYMNSVWQDVHGAGCQRSDPKTGDPNDYPTGHGPQGDAVRIYNYVRCVRDADTVQPGEPYEGYNLFAPLGSTTTYLMDNDGNFVHNWASTYNPGHSVYLLENGHLLRTGVVGNTTFNAGGAGGIVQDIDLCETVTWEYEYSSNLHLQHHDIEALPNGNVLMIAWEYKTQAEAIAAGRNPSLLTDGELWPDSVIEVQPIGPTTGNIVWEWHVWDHLIQDYDPAKDNYGVVADHPELIDLNYISSPGADWNHTNSIDYNAELDQIMLSVRSFSEIWVIDHSTTTAEASGHTGGDSGMGGDLLYRWGNLQTYGAGGSADQKLFVQHDAEWIESGLPGEGNILIFNNGTGRPAGNYSSVDEIVPPVNGDGSYTLSPGSAYGPTEAYWSYQAETPTDFYADRISGSQRLPNGNTLICNGPNGEFFEVTADKVIVWEYDYTGNVFRVDRYGLDYPGFAITSYDPCDLDEDSDVDIDDFDLFEGCATGPAIPLVYPACEDADFDGDNDVDQSDFGILQVRLGTSGYYCD